MAEWKPQTVEDHVALALYRSSVPDHETYTFGARPVAEKRAWLKQADAAIRAYCAARLMLADGEK